jgi:hypothetical protein
MNVKILIAAPLLLITSVALALDCASLTEEAKQMGVHIPSSESVMMTTGKGRVAFHSGPDAGCKEKSIFVLSGESLNAYLEYKGFTFVLYQNPRDKSEATGWVESARLKETGYGNGPN